jgi:hypothetical protein
VYLSEYCTVKIPERKLPLATVPDPNVKSTLETLSVYPSFPRSAA